MFGKWVNAFYNKLVFFFFYLYESQNENARELVPAKYRFNVKI